jgi:tetratricopeptide (TPR) repeat protein
MQPNVPQQSPSTELQRGWFLSGKVVTEDGTPPPESVTIERVCGAQRFPEAYTDSKGHFSFEVGHNQTMLGDASLSSAEAGQFGDRSTGGQFSRMGGNANEITSRRMMGCELHAVLTGYRSDMVNLSGRRLMDNPDVGTIILHRLGNVQGNTISATSLAAPKDARKAYDKGVEAINKQKWADAQKSFEKAVAAYPKYAGAWFQLGIAQMRLNNPEGAQAALAKAIEADPKYLKPYLPMASLALEQRRYQDAAGLSHTLVQLDPVDFPQAFLVNAIANASLQKFDLAEQSAREVLKLDTEHRMPYAEYVLGVSLANRQEYGPAVEMLKDYLQRVPGAANAETIRKQITQLEQQASAAPAPSTQK